MAIEHSWNGKNQKEYVPALTYTVQKYCFQISAAHITRPRVPMILHSVFFDSDAEYRYTGNAETMIKARAVMCRSPYISGIFANRIFISSSCGINVRESKVYRKWNVKYNEDGGMYMFRTQDGWVKLGDTRMEYICFGSGKKIMVLLPGLSDGLATVGGKALLLSQTYRKYMKDFKVYMFSRKNDMPDGYTIQQMAEDQAEAMKILGIHDACVNGVSEGGMIAQYLAAEHPELVARLILTVTDPCVNDMIRERIRTWTEYAKKGDHKQLMIDTAENSYSDAYLKTYRKAYPVIGMVGKPKDYRRFLINAEAILNFDARGILAEISCPVLIIGGEQDHIVGVQASYDIHALIPGSELHIYPDSGHAAYEEEKDYNDRIFTWAIRYAVQPES